MSADKSYLEAKIESIDARLDKQDSLLEKLVNTLERISKHEGRIDVVETNMTDHESRIRVIERHRWVTYLIAVAIVVATSTMVSQSIKVLTAASEQTPITKEALVEALKEANKKSEDE